MARYQSDAEVQGLMERIAELQQENSILKQSLEQLITVNKELTESIQQFNQDNIDSSFQQERISQMQNTIQTMNQELAMLRRQGNQQPKEQNLSEGETQSLVNVLEELIQSFKNMQTRYESEIQQHQQSLGNHEVRSKANAIRMSQEYESKMNAIQPILAQMKRKEESMQAIQQRIALLQRKSIKPLVNSGEVSEKIDNRQVQRLRVQMQKKDQLIGFYQNLLGKLKQKFNEKL